MNNPVNYYDPNGEYAIVDDAIFIFGGAIVGAGTQLVMDIASGSLSRPSVYAGAAAGGAAAGGVLLYTANPYFAGFANGAVGNALEQTIDLNTGYRDEYSLAEWGIHAGVGTLFGAVPGLKSQNSAIFNQMRTKFLNKTIDNVKTQTALKMFDGAASQFAMYETNIFSNGLSDYLSSEIPDEIIQIDISMSKLMDNSFSYDYIDKYNCQNYFDSYNEFYNYLDNSKGWIMSWDYYGNWYVTPYKD